MHRLSDRVAFIDALRSAWIAAAVTLLLGLASPTIVRAQESEAELQRTFESRITSFLQTHCQVCHSKDSPEADLDLSAYNSLETIARDHEKWQLVAARLKAKEMPPADADPQPSDADRQAVIRWIAEFRQFKSRQNAGDPGVVLARRLSNAEYNYTIRDLTGVDIRPARDFPVDPANEAGFDNSGESLTMSPVLLQKYLAAARQVVEHLVFKPEGFDFAPHPVVTDTDRDKYCVKRIVEFYQRQPTDYAKYFFAAWQYQHRSALDIPDATLAEMAAQNHVSAKYLAKVWSALIETKEEIGPLATVQAMWRSLPADATAADAARAGCEQIRDYIVKLRKQLEPQVDNLDVEGMHKGAQPLVLWKNRQYAAYRRDFDRRALRFLDDPKPADEEDTVIQIPAMSSDRPRYEAAFARFCELFPDAFYISERGRDYVGKPKDQQEKGRLLSAGFHSMMGYFRDDGPLYDLVLDAEQQRELDCLWQELDFIATAPVRQYTGFVWFERTDSRYLRDPEFDFARAEDKNVTSEEMIRRLADVYVAKARRNGAGAVELQAVEDYFRDMNAQIRWIETACLAAEPSHLEAMLDFAEQAYRRPMTDAERADLVEFYQMLRISDERTHEEAIQDTISAILMSPSFCYRLDLGGESERVQPLSDFELASRLSYFLSSTMPDQELLNCAAQGDLHRPEVITAQARRMLHDERVRGLAVEFGGNWLDFRRFEEHNSVDRNRFPSFSDELRRAMFEEPVRFFTDVAQADRSVLDFLYADDTFVNPVLAAHYGISLPEHIGADQWQRIERAGEHGRGGLLPMSVFLTKNAPGLRTSPVKRGYWVVRRLLGERIPPPPPNVPELPNDEQQLGELTLRDALAKHREHPSCAGCHDRFDGIGLAFEHFGPVGERRTVDLGGRAVDDSATFPGGSQGSGLQGLRSYLRQHRQDEFVDNLCRKLLSYALGRTLLLTDEPLLEQMRARLIQHDHRFGLLVESIVTSRQFLNKRGG